MRIALALLLLRVSLPCDAEPRFGIAADQLSAAAAAPSSGSSENAASNAGRWSDASSVRPPAPETGDEEDVWPRSPLAVSLDHDGFESGFSFMFSAAEWLPNLLTNSVSALGSSLGRASGDGWFSRLVKGAFHAVGTVVGGALGIGLMPVGVVAGLVGGAATAVAGFFS